MNHIAPAIISTTEGKILGQVDTQNETAAYAMKGSSVELAGPEVIKSIVLSRKTIL